MDHAHRLGLVVEIHTNSQFAPDYIRQALAQAECVGLSLDASTPDVHDAVRCRRGNFGKVHALLAFLGQAGVPVIVRTVVTLLNHHAVVGIGEILLSFRNVLAWYLLEFSPVGLGFDSRQAFEIDRERFDAVVDDATRRYDGSLQVHARRLEDKSGAYVMVSPDGKVYGTAGATVGGRYPHVGSVLRDHLSDLAAGIGFKRDVHEPRYALIELERERKLERMARASEGFQSPAIQVQSTQKGDSSGLP